MKTIIQISKLIRRFSLDFRVILSFMQDYVDDIATNVK